jgi:hypothetical protein
MAQLLRLWAGDRLPYFSFSIRSVAMHDAEHTSFYSFSIKELQILDVAGNMMIAIAGNCEIAVQTKRGSVGERTASVGGRMAAEHPYKLLLMGYFKNSIYDCL